MSLANVKQNLQKPKGGDKDCQIFGTIQKKYLFPTLLSTANSDEFHLIYRPMYLYVLILNLRGRHIGYMAGLSGLIKLKTVTPNCPQKHHFKLNPHNKRTIKCIIHNQ